jgi:hypothetical protein
MDRRFKWAAVLTLLLVALAVGVVSYNAGGLSWPCGKRSGQQRIGRSGATRSVRRIRPVRPVRLVSTVGVRVRLRAASLRAVLVPDLSLHLLGRASQAPMVLPGTV